jgi:hypothetical protein
VGRSEGPKGLETGLVEVRRATSRTRRAMPGRVAVAAETPCGSPPCARHFACSLRRWRPTFVALDATDESLVGCGAFGPKWRFCP